MAQTRLTTNMEMNVLILRSLLYKKAYLLVLTKKNNLFKTFKCEIQINSFFRYESVFIIVVNAFITNSYIIFFC